MSKATKGMKNKSRTPEEAAAIADNVLCAVLAQYGGKRFDREPFAGGDRHAAALTVCGEIDGRWVECEIEGELIVNHDQAIAKSVTPSQEVLVARLLEAIPVRRRLQLVTLLPTQFTEGKLTQPQDPELVGIAGQLLKKLRQEVTGSRRGALRFEPKPDPATSRG